MLRCVIAFLFLIQLPAIAETLAALQEIEAMPGGSTFDAWRAQAAIEQVKAEMEGRAFSGQFGNSYEEAMNEIDRMESTGAPAVDCLSAEGC